MKGVAFGPRPLSFFCFRKTKIYLSQSRRGRRESNLFDCKIKNRLLCYLFFSAFLCASSESAAADERAGDKVFDFRAFVIGL